MNKAKILMDKREAHRDARKRFLVEAVGWVVLAGGSSLVGLIWYTTAVVVLGGDL
tara:strand:+ start:586 stop:750 length:165 start_codon:yes stop_codon:yes gene_type:complete